VIAAIVLLLVAGTVVAAVALGSGDGGGDRELADLEPALLTVDDVGEGFTPTRDEDEDTLDLDEADMDEECREALQRFAAGDDDEGDNLKATFERERDGVGVEHELALVDSGEPTLDQVADALGRCDRIAYEDQGRPVEMLMSVGEVDGLGEEALELDLSVTVTVMADAEITVEAYALVVIRDDTASTVFVTGALDPTTLVPGPVDRDLARQLAATADERIRELD
jgi:hypothetical protein